MICSFEEKIDIEEKICKMLRNTVREFGQRKVTGAIIIGPWDLGDCVGGHRYIMAPTIGTATLAYVSWEICRFFEDALL